VPVVAPDPRVAVGAGPCGESTAAVRERVEAARSRAVGRGVVANRQLRGSALERHAPLTDAAADVLRVALVDGRLSMRGAARVRAVALTLADLHDRPPPIGADEVDLALALRADDVAIGDAA
jgi:magnesium chelatase family protein